MREASFPEDENDRTDAADGTAAHWAVEQMLLGHTIAEGLQAPNGVFLTREMVEGAELMDADVRAELAAYGLTPRDGFIERRLAISRVHAQSFGTPDFYVWLGGPNLLLYDYKFGHGVVEVFRNAQLVEYVAGAIEAAGLSDLQVRVRMKIVQPRSFHRDGPVRTWEVNAADLRAQINIQAMAAEEALGPNPRAQTGPECKNCRARHACPQLQRVAFAAMDVSEQSAPLELPPAALALEYRMVNEAIKRLEARRSGLEANALATIKRGVPVPGLAVEHGAGRERWTRSDESVIALGRMVGIDLAKPPEAITPKQAVARGFPLAQFPGLNETPRSAAKLVVDDGTAAARIFGAAR
jgi:hypothetical protein